MRNILLIGGTGVLSTAVTKESLQKGIKVTMINRGNNRKKIPEQAELIVSDKNNTEYIRKKLEGRHFDAVIDFLCFNDKELENSFNLYSSFTDQYFFISTAGVYNNCISGPCDEDHPKVQPLWPYSINKWKSEEKLVLLASKANVKYTIIRPMVTYDDTRIPYGIAPFYGFHWTFVSRILNNKPIISWNNGENRCNMMRVEDFAIGVVGLIGNEKAYNEAFNICGDETPSYKEVMDTVGRIVNHPVIYVDIDSRFYAEKYPERKGELLGGRAIDSIIDNSKIKAVVPEFRQNILLEEGIRKTIDAYISKKYQKGIDWNFDADTDRVISQWCKHKGINAKEYNLHFLDYLSNATLNDRMNYYLRRYRNLFWVSLYLKFESWLKVTAYKILNKIK